jgi:hypothetical protein
MSEDVSLHAWTLPNDWEVRRVLIGTYGQLQVYAPSRIDLIRMKFIAHREGDLEHLEHMRVRAEELELVRSYLASLELRYPDEIGRIQMARQYVDSWENEL